MTNLRTSPAEVKAFRAAEGRNHLYLLGQLVRRDFQLRFTGSALGVAWAVLQPLSLVILYWFVFTRLIPPRVPQAGGGSYVLFLISGLIPWLGLSEGIMRSTTTIVDNAALVRRLAFRSEVLVVVPNVTAILFETIAMALLASVLAARGLPMNQVWIFPFAVGIQLLLQIGLGWILAALYVFFRDVTQILGFALSIVFYLSPILYPASGRFESFFRWNPMTALLGLFRSALTSAPLPEVSSIVFLLTTTAVIFLGGLRLFRRAQPSLVDLI